MDILKQATVAETRDEVDALWAVVWEFAKTLPVPKPLFASLFVDNSAPGHKPPTGDYALVYGAVRVLIRKSARGWVPGTPLPEEPPCKIAVLAEINRWEAR